MSSAALLYRADLDATKFRAGVDEMEAAADRAGRATAGARGEVARFTSTQERFDKATERSRDSVARSTTAISTMRDVTGTSTAAVMDLVSAVDDLSEGFAKGGALTIGITAVAIGLGLLVDWWGKVERKAKEAAEASIKAATDIAGKIQDATAALDKRLSTALGLDDQRLAVEQLRATLALLESQTESVVSVQTDLVKAGLPFVVAEERAKEIVAGHALEVDNLRGALANAELALEEYEAKLAVVKRTEAAAKDVASQYAAAVDKATAAVKRRARVEREEPFDEVKAASSFLDGFSDPRIEAHRAEEEEIARLTEARIARQIAANEEAFDREIDLLDARIEAAKVAHASYATTASTAYGIAADVAVSSLDQIIAGEEGGWARIAESTLKAIGTRLIASGTETAALGTAAVILSHGMDPAGYAAIAQGGVMAGLGVGMGGAGTFVGAGAGGLLSTGGETPGDLSGLVAGVDRPDPVAGGSLGSVPQADSGSTSVTIVNNGPSVVGDASVGAWLARTMDASARNRLRPAA